MSHYIKSSTNEPNALTLQFLCQYTKVWSKSAAKCWLSNLKDKATSRQESGMRGANFCWTLTPKNVRQPQLITQSWNEAKYCVYPLCVILQAKFKAYIPKYLFDKSTHRQGVRNAGWIFCLTFTPRSVKQVISHSWNGARQLRALSVISWVKNCKRKCKLQRI